MAGTTVTTRFTTVEGPIKRELIVCNATGAGSTDVESRLQNPKYVKVEGSPAAKGTITASVSSGKTLSVTTLAALGEFLLEVWGY